MPTKRKRRVRAKRPVIARDMVAWLKGKGKMPVAGYFLFPKEEAELKRLIASGDYIEGEPED